MVVIIRLDQTHQKFSYEVFSDFGFQSGLHGVWDDKRDPNLFLLLRRRQ